MNRLLLTALCSLLALSPVPAQERGKRLEGEVSAHEFSRIKIAVPAVEAVAAIAEPAAEAAETIRADLLFSGYFDVIDPELYRLVPAAEGSEPRHEDWLSIGADALLSLNLQVDGQRVSVLARLYDNASESVLFARRYGGTTALLRRVAHNVSDDLVRHYTGRSGIAMTRIAFVSQHGEGKEIYLMDYDGRNIRRLTTTGTINLSPVWSPPGDELAFVSWRAKQPGVFVMNSEGQLGHLATVGGELSAAPEWSPDGRKLVYSSDIDGNTELYLLDRVRGRNTRLTRHPGIDTAPAFSPNGREIAFTSDRTGSPQIYLMDSEGLNVRRVSWGASYNDAAAWSPDGAKLAYSSRIEGRFEIVVLDLSTDRTTRLTWGEGNNENPRWSPDGRHLVFASNRRGGVYQIYTMRADGADVRRLTRGRASFTPDWSR